MKERPGYIVARWKEDWVATFSLNESGQAQRFACGGGYVIDKPVQHPTRDAALQEAKRLAGKEGKAFFVLAPVMRVAPKVVEVDLQYIPQ